MKRINIIISVVMFFLLVGSSLYLGGSTAAPSTTLETGDHFVYDTTGTHYREDDFYFAMYNTSNPDQFFRIELDNHVEDINSAGDADVTIIRSRPTLPPVDTMVLVDSFATFGAGSYRNGSHAVWGDEGSPTWQNDTFPTEFLEGQTWDDGNDEPEFYTSNETYSLIFPEMVNTTLDFPFFPHDMQWSFDGKVHLDSRTVYNDTNVAWIINGNNYNLDTTEVFSTFSAYHEETYETNMTFGDHNDPNAETHEVNMTIWLDVFMDFTFVFDTSNGMLLNFYQYHYATFGRDMWAQDLFQDTYPEGPGGELYYDFVSNSTFTEENSQESTIRDASSFYGNTRPTSSGDNRIKEGDVLKYNVEIANWGDMSTYVEGGNPDVDGFKEETNRFQEGESHGTMLFDVYRHEPGMFEAVIFYDGVRNGSYSYFEEKWEAGNYMPGDSEAMDFGPEPDNFIDAEMFISTSDYEIQYFFEPETHFERPFECRDGDCGGEFYPYFDNLIPMDGPVNETNFYINLLAGDVDGEPFDINGFTFYEFNVSAAIQNYYTYQSTTIEIPLGDGPEAIWVNASMDIEAKAESGWYYDSDTGALVVHDEQTDFNVHIWGSWNVELDPHNNPGVFTQVDVDAWISGGERFFMQLSEHPYLYQSQPTVPEIPTTTSTTSSSTTTSSGTSTTDTSSSSTEPTSSDTNTTSTGVPSVDLPVPVIPVAAGLGAFVTIVRLRRRS